MLKAQLTEDWKARWRSAKTNGCSNSPDLWMHEACDAHDKDYGTHHDEDGNPLTRWQSDVRLLKAARAKAPGITPVDRFIIRNTIPTFYFLMVRAFGWKFW